MTKTVAPVQQTIPNRLLQRQAVQRGRLRGSRSASEQIRRVHFADLHPSIFPRPVLTIDRQRTKEPSINRLRANEQLTRLYSKPKSPASSFERPAPFSPRRSNSPSSSAASSICITINSEDECLCADTFTASHHQNCPNFDSIEHASKDYHTSKVIYEPALRSKSQSPNPVRSDSPSPRPPTPQSSAPSVTHSLNPNDNNTISKEKSKSIHFSKVDEPESIAAHSNRTDGRFNNTNQDSTRSNQALPSRLNQNQSPCPPSNQSKPFKSPSVTSSDSETYQAQQAELQRLKVLMRSPEAGSPDVSIEDPLDSENKSLVLFHRSPTPSESPPVGSPIGFYANFSAFRPKKFAEASDSEHSLPSNDFSLAFSASPYDPPSFMNVNNMARRQGSHKKLKSVTLFKKVKSRTAIQPASPRTPTKTQNRPKPVTTTELQRPIHRSAQKNPPLTPDPKAKAISIVTLKTAAGMMPLKPASPPVLSMGRLPPPAFSPSTPIESRSPPYLPLASPPSSNVQMSSMSPSNTKTSLMYETPPQPYLRQSPIVDLSPDAIYSSSLQDKSDMAKSSLIMSQSMPPTKSTQPSKSQLPKTSRFVSDTLESSTAPISAGSMAIIPPTNEVLVDALHSVVRHLMRAQSLMCETTQQSKGSAFLKLEFKQKSVGISSLNDPGQSFQVTTWINEKLDPEISE